MRNIGAPEIILILLLVVLLFGAKKLPDTARGLGRSLRIFKAETKGLHDDDDEPGPAPADEPARRPAPREVTGRVVEEPTPAPQRPAQVRTEPYGSSLGPSSLGGSSLHDPYPGASDADGQGRGPADTSDR